MEFLTWWLEEHPAEFVFVATLLGFSVWILFRTLMNSASGGTATRISASALTVALIICISFAGVWLSMLGMDWLRGHRVDLSKPVGGVPGYAFVMTSVLVAAIRSAGRK